MSYTDQRVMECIDLLIGEFSHENANRLRSAAAEASPVARPGQEVLRPETINHLRQFHGKMDSIQDPESFYFVKEHLVAYLIESQRDRGRADAQIPANCA